MKKLDISTERFPTAFAMVDDEDYEKLKKWKWHAKRYKPNSTLYAVRNVEIDGVHKTLLMHRVVMSAPVGRICDHRDGDGLNNQKSNLRLCDNSENCANRGVSTRKKTSKYRGVYYNKRDQAFRVTLTKNGQSHHIGTFKDEVAAAVAYNKAAIDHLGEFAWLNAIPGEQR